MPGFLLYNETWELIAFIFHILQSPWTTYLISIDIQPIIYSLQLINTLIWHKHMIKGDLNSIQA